MAGDVVGARRAGDCAGAAPRRDLPPEQVADLTKQRKREANARHRARKKAMAGLEEALALVQLDAEKQRGTELAATHAAMNALKEYQEEALRVLQFASLTENVDGEVALIDTQDLAALDSSRMAALLAAEQQRAAAQRAQRQASSDSEGSEAAEDASGAQSSRAGAAAPRQAQQAAPPCVPAPESAAASACSGGNASGAPGASRAASAAAASTAAVPPGEAEPSQSGKSQAGAAATGAADAAAAAGAASASQTAGGGSGGDATSTQEQREFVSARLAELDDMSRNWRATQVPEVRSTFVRVAAAALNFMSTQVISQRNREFTVQLQHLVQRWEACPGSRREIEEQIAGRIGTRHAVIQYLVKHRVPVLMELWGMNCCPPAAPGTPSLDGRPTIHHVLLPIAQYLQANLTPNQLKELEAAWSSYQTAVEAARQQRTAAAVQLQYAAALQSISWQKQSTQPSGGCTAERSQAYNAMAESTGCLSTLGHSEMAALVELQEALIRVLSPIQMARVFLTSFPYNPDMTQICKWLFSKPAAAALPAATSAYAGAPLQAAATAVPASSSEASRGAPLAGAALPGAPLPPSAPLGGAPLPPGAALPPGVAPPPLAPDTFDTLGLLPDSGTDAFMDLLTDGELDMLIADLAGGCHDSGHLLAASSPHLP